ncbi:uncharacterized protein PSFLO_02308 [Pseudozyma flocculosa]|uniref:Uncharacterized protein n=1 Tax=Pseudozyma flocculosa TaxID=84751 RepID=A0A5C3EZJ3_9BASI|nr:uncharacterized protein PSFLO_02308 [Pseudozyma flocculosa]
MALHQVTGSTKQESAASASQPRQATETRGEGGRARWRLLLGSACPVQGCDDRPSLGWEGFAGGAEPHAPRLLSGRPAARYFLWLSCALAPSSSVPGLRFRPLMPTTPCAARGLAPHQERACSMLSSTHGMAEETVISASPVPGRRPSRQERDGGREGGSCASGQEAPLATKNPAPLTYLPCPRSDSDSDDVDRAGNDNRKDCRWIRRAVAAPRSSGEGHAVTERSPGSPSRRQAPVAKTAE